MSVFGVHRTYRGRAERRARAQSMFPVRCYSCNAPLAHLHPRYRRETRSAASKPGQTLTALGVDRLCCRRMFLGHVDLLADLIDFPNTDCVLDRGGTTLQRRVHFTRKVTCD